MLAREVRAELPAAGVQRLKTLAREAVRAHKGEERMGRVERELV